MVHSDRLLDKEGWRTIEGGFVALNSALCLSPAISAGHGVSSPRWTVPGVEPGVGWS